MLQIVKTTVMGFLYFTSLITLYGLSRKLSNDFSIVGLILVFIVILSLSYLLGGLL